MGRHLSIGLAALATYLGGFAVQPSLAQSVAPSVRAIYSITGSPTGLGSSTAAGAFSAPRDVAVLANGQMAVVDSGNNRIQILDAAGNFVSSFSVNAPQVIAALPNNNLVVSAGGNSSSTVQIMTTAGAVVANLSRLSPFGAIPNFANTIVALAVGPQGNIYLADRIYPNVYVYNSAGQSTGAFFPAGFNGIAALSTAPDGTVTVGDVTSNKVSLFSATGVATGVSFGSVGTGPGQFQSIGGIQSFANGTIAVADTVQNNIEFFSSTGVYLTAIGSTGTGALQFNNLGAIRGTAAGNLVVADRGNNRVTVLGVSQTTVVVPTTDLWWNQTSSGAGFGIEVNPITGNLLLGAYMYGNDGRADWYYAVMTRTGNNFSGPLVRQRLGSTLASTATPTTITTDALGTVQLAFTSASAGTLTLPGAQPLAIAPFTLQPQANSIGQPGWYYEPTVPDRAYFISAQGSATSIVLAYSRAGDGSAGWIYGTAPVVSTTLTQLLLQEYQNGPTLTALQRAPGSINNSVVGNVSLLWGNSGGAQLTTTMGGRYNVVREGF